MKKLIAVFLCLALLCLSVTAICEEDLIGIWKPQKFVVNGNQAVNQAVNDIVGPISKSSIYEFTDEGLYTITVTNRDLGNIDPTVKRVYVGTDNIMKAYMVNNLSISEIKEMLALGATITDEGIIIPPEPEPVVETETEKKTEEIETNDDVVEEATAVQSTEETVPDDIAQNTPVTETEKANNAVEEKIQKKSGSMIIPIFIMVVVVAGGFLVMYRKKK